MTGALTNKPEISIIVPVFNEINFINDFLLHLKSTCKRSQEIIVVDGGSTDGTWQWLETLTDISILQTKAGRANQMNYGACLLYTSPSPRD